ncbi:SAM-dependent methyltransferase [Methanocella sp. CWC-04]|uniref:SAM-dependent methyltransferase n=1 Tax=Methanooceanicella nereidis TaxID=2052831 RepID=A0AAP2RF93_9EURY|nr:class I SAM-dependent methyltransferase [Methanocella sp. CWC-04]MCD1295142.1 SAM-dependent methyltransferase [Methanocella sp. CWC-04]
MDMENYWDDRFSGEGKIWGDTPSRTAVYARDLFINDDVKSVLVPGAGYGRNASLFYNSGFDVTCIEISKEAINMGKEASPDLKFIHGSVLDMPCYGVQYDAIYCFNVLHLLYRDDRMAFIRKCLDTLNDGGSVFFTVFSEKEGSYGKGAEIEPDTFESKPGRPVHYFTDDDLRSHFKDFRVLETGVMEDHEDHGEEGPHTHILRYIYAKRS